MKCPCDQEAQKDEAEQWFCRFCGAERRKNAQSGNWIWIRAGRVVAADEDLRAAIKDTEEAYGDRVILPDSARRLKQE